jgi:uncharacterized membrane protein YqgA involved in biofilm formation
MIGTFINVGTVLAGTIFGALVGSRLPERFRETVLHVLGLFTLLLGVDAGLQAFRPPLTEVAPRFAVLLILGGLLLGGLVGELIGIDRGLTRAGDALKARFGRKQARFTEGFVTASLVFCVGPLTILGSIQDGLTPSFELLAIKSLLDGFAAIAFAAALGWGVGFAALTVLLFQGTLTLLAQAAEDIFSPATIAAMTAAGGVLIMAIGLRLLNLRDVRVANLLPALLFAPLAVGVVERLG